MTHENNQQRSKQREDSPNSPVSADGGPSPLVSGDNVREYLIRKWALFARIFLSPSVLILVLATVGFAVLSVYVGGRLTVDGMSTPATLTYTVLIVLTAIAASLAGAFIDRKLSELSEGSIILTRGRSAVRGLKLLLLNVAALERRILKLMSRIDQEGASSELRRNNYEELVERSGLIQESLTNAVEEWRDIVPEAEAMTQLGEISRLKEHQNDLLDDIAKLEDKLKSQMERSAEDEAKWTKEISRKQRELEAVKHELNQKKIEIETMGQISLSTAFVDYDTPKITEPGSTLREALGGFGGDSDS